MSADFWNERFGSEEYAYGREANEFVVAQAARIPRGRVLCLAEGEGRNAVFLAGLGHEVTAVDLSTEGLRKTERLAKERDVTVTTVHADLATYEPEEGAFTGIVSVWAHLPPAVRARVHGWVTRALRPGASPGKPARARTRACTSAPEGQPPSALANCASTIPRPAASAVMPYTPTQGA